MRFDDTPSNGNDPSSALVFPGESSISGLEGLDVTPAPTVTDSGLQEVILCSQLHWQSRNNDTYMSGLL